jgi:hypothetical protein
MQTEPENISIETLAPISTTALESITRGEIDVQISTAKRYPRSLSQFKTKALAMVSMDEQTAESCFYSRPVGKDLQTGKQKYAEGMSVRLAEIVAACYGNIRHGSFIVTQTDRQVVARGFCHDVEGNVAATCEAVEATVKRDGRPYDERMRVVIAKAALAKADRDAIFKVVPRALCRVLEDAARKVAIGDAQSISSRREAALAWAGKLGVSNARVFAALDVKGADDITGEHIKTLLGLKTALQDNDITVEEAFPHPDGGAFPGTPATTKPGGTTATDGEPAPKPTGKATKPPGKAASAPKPAEQQKTPEPPANAQTGGKSETSTDGETLFTDEPNPATNSPAGALLERLTAAGITEARAIEIAKKNRVPVGATLADTDTKIISMLNADFDSLVAMAKGK